MAVSRGKITAKSGKPVTAGELPGESHTLVSYAHEDPMRVFFVVSGPLMWLDEQGNTVGHYDVFDYMRDARAHYKEVGIADDYLDSLIR